MDEALDKYFPEYKDQAIDYIEMEVEKFATNIMSQFDNQSSLTNFLSMVLEIPKEDKIYGYISSFGLTEFMYLFVDKGFLPVLENINDIEDGYHFLICKKV